MEMRLQNWLLHLIGFGWSSTAGVEFAYDWRFANAGVAPVSAPTRWPAGSAVKLSTDQLTLVMFAHPRCPCSRASVTELGHLLARNCQPVAATVFFYQPLSQPLAWAQSDLWRQAAALRGVQVKADLDNREADCFQAASSGQVALYDTDGRMLFNGSICGKVCGNICASVCDVRTQAVTNGQPQQTLADILQGQPRLNFQSPLPTQVDGALPSHGQAS